MGLSECGLLASAARTISKSFQADIAIDRLSQPLLLGK